MSADLLLAAVIAVALFFDFTNGFHDAANAIATGIATKALRPRTAVAMAAVLNFAGAFVSLKVAATIAKGIVDPTVMTLEVVLAGLIGAITWNLVTWFLGLPSSSSHALIGGVAGAAIAGHGFGVIKVDGLVHKVVEPSLAAPVLGIVVAFTIAGIILLAVRRARPESVNRTFRRLQPLSAGFLAFTHGTNDAQKTMGIITLALITAGHASADNFDVPTWVIVSAATAMALGTWAGGWRIIHTLGSRITALSPPQGFAAEASCGGLLYVTGHLGFPVSTTHVISGAVMGAGATRGLKTVTWSIAGRIVLAWIMTIPCAAVVGALMAALTRIPGGAALVVLVGVLVAGAAFLSRGRLTHHHQPEVAPVGH